MKGAQRGLNPHSVDWYLHRLSQHGPVMIETHLWPKAGFKASVVCKAGRVDATDQVLLGALAELLTKTREKLRAYVSRLQG